MTSGVTHITHIPFASLSLTHHTRIQSQAPLRCEWASRLMMMMVMMITKQAVAVPCREGISAYEPAEAASGLTGPKQSGPAQERGAPASPSDDATPPTSCSMLPGRLSLDLDSGVGLGLGYPYCEELAPSPSEPGHSTPRDTFSALQQAGSCWSMSCSSSDADECSLAPVLPSWRQGDSGRPSAPQSPSFQEAPQHGLEVQQPLQLQPGEAGGLVFSTSCFPAISTPRPFTGGGAAASVCAVDDGVVVQGGSMPIPRLPIVQPSPEVSPHLPQPPLSCMPAHQVPGYNQGSSPPVRVSDYGALMRKDTTVSGINMWPDVGGIMRKDTAVSGINMWPDVGGMMRKDTAASGLNMWPDVDSMLELHSADRDSEEAYCCPAAAGSASVAASAGAAYLANPCPRLSAWNPRHSCGLVAEGEGEGDEEEVASGRHAQGAGVLQACDGMAGPSTATPPLSPSAYAPRGAGGMMHSQDLTGCVIHQHDGELERSLDLDQDLATMADFMSEESVRPGAQGLQQQMQVGCWGVGL